LTSLIEPWERVVELRLMAASDLLWWGGAGGVMLGLAVGILIMSGRGCGRGRTKPDRPIVAAVGLAMLGLGCLLEGVEAVRSGAFGQASVYGAIVVEVVVLVLLLRRGRRGAWRRTRRGSGRWNAPPQAPAD